MSTRTHSYIVSHNFFSIPYVSTIIDCAEEYNVIVYFVGGCVRDFYLNKDIKDIDITVFGMDYVKFAKILSRKLKAFMVTFKDNVRLSKGHMIFDVSKPRGSNIEEDLYLRDFTINNLAINNKLLGVGSKDDIYNKIIKVVNDNVFDNDPLRILRTFRFVSTLGFQIDDYTYNLALSKIDLLKNVAKERITEELRKTFFGSYLPQSIKYLKESKILENYFNSPLDYESILYKKFSSFALYIALFLGKNYINQLTLSSKEEKLVLYLVDNYEEILKFKDMTLLEKRSFVWRNYKYIDDLVDFVVAKNQNLKEHYTVIADLKSSLNFDKSKFINGDYLINLGYKPSHMFSEIINVVAEKLALDLIETSEVEEYIKSNYKI